MNNPEILLGVTGGIAAYKACEIASALTQRGVVVHVVMTEAATKLVTPRTFQTLTRQPVMTDLWETPDWQPEHVALAQRCSLLAIAPCTANMIGKIAHGIGDDALSTCVLANEAPVLLAPAMNPAMWRNAAVQENVATLKRRGVTLIGPESGHVACGAEGAGRMSEPEVIVKAILEKLNLKA